MHTPLRLSAVLITAAVAVAVTGCGSSTSSSSVTNAAASTSATATAAAATATAAATFPVTVTASNGKVTIKSKPTRIVSLDPTATEDLYGVGAGAQVVAVDQDSNYPATAKKTSLSGLTPNLEAIAKYNPSLVIDSQNSGGLAAGLAKLGIPVLIEPAATTLTDAYTQIEQIGQATGHAAQAQQLVASMTQQITESVAKAKASVSAAKTTTSLTYYWELSANPFYSATSGTFIGQVVSLFGLKNIADKVSKPADGGYPELSQEYIVAAKPMIIFLADNEQADGAQSPAIVAKRPGWSGIPAVKNNEVIALNDDVASRWGPRLPLLVAEIAQAVEQAAK